jgi:hypothetical protein
MAQKRITAPGITDLDWMVVICGPGAQEVSVEFHESEEEAAEAMSAALKPRVTSYYGPVTKQGEFR